MVKKKSIFPLTKLSDVVSMKSGESITAERITSEGKFPCFGGNGLRGYTTTFTHDGSYTLVGRQGALCGNVTFVSGRFYASEHAIVVMPKKETDIKFMSYVLYDMNLNQYSESSAQPGLSVKKLLELEYPIPQNKEEQTAIAEALSDIDSLISSLQKLIEKKKAIKQGAMQELLTGKKRLPGFCQKWAKKYLKEIIVPRKERINPAEIDNRKCIELEHIEPNSGKILGYCESKEQKSLKTIFYPNDILWGKLRPYLRKYAHPKFSGVCSTEFWVFNAINQYACNDFMYYLLQTEDFVSAANSTTGTKMPRADWNLVQELEISIPADKNEQQAIAQVLCDMDSEIERLEKKFAKYQQIKQGMMQELLTGRVRMKEGKDNARN